MALHGIAGRTELRDEEYVAASLPSATLAAFESGYELLVKELRHVDALTAALYSAQQLVQLDYPLALPEESESEVQAATAKQQQQRQSAVVAALRGLLARIFLNRRVAAQVELSAEEQRLQRQRDRRELEREMQSLRLVPEDLRKIDAQEVLVFSGALEKCSRERASVPVFGGLFAAAPLPLRRRLGEELWAAAVRADQLEQEEEAKGKGKGKKGQTGVQQRRVRFILQKLSYWATADGGTGTTSRASCHQIPAMDADLLNEDLGIRLPAPIPLPQGLPAALALAKTRRSKTRGKVRVIKDRLQMVLDRLDPEGSGFISARGLLPWIESGAHLDFAFLLPSLQLWWRRAAVRLLGRRFEFAEVHAETVLRAESRRRTRAQLAMEQRMQSLSAALWRDEAALEAVYAALRRFNLERLRKMRSARGRRVSWQGSEDAGSEAAATAEFIAALRRFAALQAAREDFEDSVLYRYLEERASARLFQSLLVAATCPPLAPRRHRKTWRRERLFVEQLQDAVETMSFLQRDSVRSGQAVEEFSAMELWVRALDVECSGGFDEERVLEVARSLRAPISRTQLLRDFPELALPAAKMPVRTLVEYLERQPGAMDGSRLRRASTARTALTLATSWTRVAVRRELRQSLSASIAHPGGHHIVSVDDLEPLPPPRDDDDDEEKALSSMVRAQLLSLRQLQMFLRTTHGRLQLAEVQEAVTCAWTVHVEGSFVSSTSRRVETKVFNALRFAYFLHHEREGMLSSELPHLLRYLVTRLQVPLDAAAAARSASKWMSDHLRAAPRAQWLSFDAVWRWLAPHLAHPAAGGGGDLVQLRRGLRLDALTKMRSSARQQAAEVALHCRHVVAPETNYRCAVLGLHAVIERNRDQRRTDWSLRRRSQDRDSYLARKALLDWSSIPREAAPLLLLSRGYSVPQLFDPSLQPELCLGRHRGQSGALHADTVSTQRLLAVTEKVFARDGRSLSSMLTLPQRGWRVLRGRAAYWDEYRRVVKAMQLQTEEVDAAGAAFLSEIVTGLSSTKPSPF